MGMVLQAGGSKAGIHDMTTAAGFFLAGIALAGLLTGHRGVLGALAISAVVLIATSTFYLVRGACQHDDKTHP